MNVISTPYPSGIEIPQLELTNHTVQDVPCYEITCLLQEHLLSGGGGESNEMPVYFATETEKTAELVEALAGSEQAAGKGTASQGKRTVRTLTNKD